MNLLANQLVFPIYLHSLVSMNEPNWMENVDALKNKLKDAAQKINIDDTPAKNVKAKPKPIYVTDDIIMDGKCPVMDCDKDTYAVYLQSGYGLNTCPMICYQGHNLINHDYNTKCPETFRGLTIAVLGNLPPPKVKQKKTFDAYVRDEDLLNFLLSSNVQDGDVILVVSFDDSSTSLHESTRNVFSYYGSQLIQEIRFRDSFVMIGQKGLEKGAAFEMMKHKRSTEDFAPPVTLAMCLTLPSKLHFAVIKGHLLTHLLYISFLQLVPYQNSQMQTR